MPGGHLEPTETFSQCAHRETEEEAGVRIKNLSFYTATNDVFPETLEHYVTIIMISDFDGGFVTLKEPDVFERWDWFNWDALPNPVSQCIQTLKKQGFDPFSSR